jgi:hypothetical protein
MEQQTTLSMHFAASMATEPAFPNRKNLVELFVRI